MADNTINYITPAGFERLRAEYHQLLQVERPKLVETVAWAASNGDRSENADYIYGKRRLREIDSRLRFLSGRMEKAMVVDPAAGSGATIVFGATVTLENEEGETLVYQIVGEDEFDGKAGKISWKSPMARALMGRKCGDEVFVKKPSGEEVLSITAVDWK